MQVTKDLQKLELCERVAELLDWADGVEIEPGRLWWLASADVLNWPWMLAELRAACEAPYGAAVTTRRNDSGGVGRLFAPCRESRSDMKQLGLPRPCSRGPCCFSTTPAPPGSEIDTGKLPFCASPTRATTAKPRQILHSERRLCDTMRIV